MLQIRMGVHDSPKEITLELEQTAKEFVAQIEAGIRDATPMIWMTDRKGKQVGIPAGKLAYVEIEPETTSRSVGFAP